ncbi:MAG TPA: hypothetical protein DIW47_01800 [Bacteroidetes bacterium]|nr:hypothetical protein [Bacteroidota bacterium]
MDKALKIETILSQIRKLDHETRLYLMERLVRLVGQQDRKKEKTSSHLLELNNLGAEIWKDVNIDQYVQQERQWD